METKLIGILFLTSLLVAGCAGRVEPLREEAGQTGYASWYGDQFHMKKTASGERYDMNGLTGAHRTAPFGTMVRVVNLDNRASTVVRINDRGPFVRGRIIDLSLAAAREIGLVEKGTARVRLEFLGKGTGAGRLFVQAGSFRDPQNAAQLAHTLSERHPGRPARLETSEGVHRVWFGPFEDDEKAARWIEELENDGISAYVLRQ